MTIYTVSNFGRIRNINRWKILKTQINYSGYEMVSLWVGGEGGYSKTISVHKLVLTHHRFLLTSRILEINHKDTNKLNNRLDNLEWVTRLENMQHARRMGLIKVGRDSPNAKYSRDQIIEVCEMMQAGLDNTQIEQATSVSYTVIHNVRNGNTCTDISCDYNFPRLDLTYSKKYPRELRMKIIELVQDGWENNDIRNKLGLEFNTSTYDLVRHIISNVEERSTTIPYGSTL